MACEVFLKRGRCGKIYKLTEPNETLIRKEFSPALSANILNWFFYRSPHPASVPSGWHYAYWKRRLAARLSRLVGEPIHICDSLREDPDRANAFLMKFVEGQPPKKSELTAIHQKADKLERFFHEIGMPTWSFSRRNPFSADNFILSGGEIHIVDYEQSVPMPDLDRRIRYDEIDFKVLGGFLENNKKTILETLGPADAQEVENAFRLSLDYYSRTDFIPRATTHALEKILVKRR